MFTLWYDGKLPSRGGRDDKHHLRSAFDPQLKELWGSGPLRGLQHARAPDADVTHVVSAFGSHYLVLVRPIVGMVELDLTLLTPTEPRLPALSGTDIDNRLKTLFDALRLPSQAQEVPKQGQRRPVEDPMCVLLEDDRLVSSVSVRADRYLGAPGRDDVRLLLKVRVHSEHTPRTWHNVAFI